MKKFIVFTHETSQDKYNVTYGQMYLEGEIGNGDEEIKIWTSAQPSTYKYHRVFLTNKQIGTIEEIKK